MNKAAGRILLCIGLLILAMHIYILHYLAGLNWTNTLTDSIFSTVILMLAIWGAMLIIKAYPTKVGLSLYALLIGTGFSALTIFTELQVLKWWLGDDPKYTAWLSDTIAIRSIIVWLVCCWLGTYAALRKKVATVEKRLQQQSDASTLLREAELFKLRQQLQPHFLYNSLNSISALIMIQPDKAQEMIGRLSDFLRSSVKREAQDTISIAEELLYIESYLAIESVRFGDRLNVHIEKEYTDDATIPPFLLQPVLENAIKFGLYGKTGRVDISVHIALKESVLTIIITNPYDPQTSPPKGTGFGLEGIKRRLYLLYARTDLLETQKDEENFTTILKIPQ